MPDREHVICFGEVLWDCLPQGLFLGGAPANVAYHLARLGCEVSLVSAVGADLLGDETLRRIGAWGVDTRFVTRVPERQTGVVMVDLTDPTHPSYDIVTDVAWDHIAGSAELFREAEAADALVFGSLAQRGPHNRELLGKLLSTAGGMKVFDVNLRPPFVDCDLVLALARQSDLIKLNDEELSFLSPLNMSPLDGARWLSGETGCGKVCVTCGAKGAGLLIGDAWYWADARSIAVKDTVGAGDAFLAALIAGLLDQSQGPDQVLARAARLAEFVAQSDGATPEYAGLDQILRQAGSA